ncbi:hypothetical protein WA026_006376 [Henosepilachna vigintioctopunctata]|uniref:Retrovirus-related Pol polyprotein from transposon TNT 1-94 n=1 Tax=Henosepilachna vigintioctopunctata TaxID=420089 RepID=A0AAW1TJB8_9CUCU
MDIVRSQLETLAEDSQGNVNYESWRFKLDLTMKARKLFQVATGVEVRPHGDESSTTVSTWIAKDLEAQTLIGLNCNSNIARKLAKCNSAHVMLQKLDLLYGKKSDISIEGLQRQFFGYKYNESKSIIENCMQIQEYADSLSAEGEDVKDSWIMQRILTILPPKLHHFRSAWHNVSEPDKNLSNLFDRLRLEEDMLTGDEVNKNSTQNAFMSRHNNKSGKSQVIRKGSVECYKCGLKGHRKSQCHGERRALITVSLSAANVKKELVDGNSWYQDCGATQHMSSHKEWFNNYKPLKIQSSVLIGDASELEGVGIGDINLEAFNGKDWDKIILKNVLYVPKMPFNLFSVSSILDKGYEQSAVAEKSIFKDFRGNIVAMALRIDKLYKMQFRLEPPEKCLLNVSIKKWHERFGHQNVVYVRNILKRNGINYQDDWDDYVCPGCTYGKQHRVSHPANTKRSSKPLDLIHVDLCEMNILSLGGAKYFLLFKDDFSHFRTVYFLKNKSEAAEKLKAYIKLVKNQFGKNVKTLRSDNGTEIKNGDVNKFLESLGIFHSKSCAYTPQQNGRIEREMRTVVEAARTVLHARNLNENLWAEAVNYSVFTLNQTGTSSVENKSPADLWFGRRIDVKKLKIFGCDCYVFIEDQMRKKTEKKSVKGIFVGYDIDCPGFRIYVESESDVISSCNVIFDEEVGTESFIELDMKPLNSTPEVEDQEDKHNSHEFLNQYELGFEESDEVTTSDSDIEIPIKNSIRKLRDRQKLKAPARYKDFVTDSGLRMQRIDSTIIDKVEDISVVNSNIEMSVPNSYEEAITCPDKDNWKSAIESELKSHEDNKTWTITDRTGKKPITCKWVFCLKKNKKGEIERYKARLCARGFAQVKDIDYKETFSPTTRYDSIRILLSIAAREDYGMEQFDVKTAFLYGELTEEIYMEVPEGIKVDSSKVVKLNKSLYGLKQSSRCWNKKFSSFLVSYGFKVCSADNCVFVGYFNSFKVVLIIYVDDGLLLSKSKGAMNFILNDLGNNFEIKRITLNSFVGMEITKKENSVIISQFNYIENIINKFNLYDAKSCNTPADVNVQLTKNDNETVNNFPYREAVGALLFLSSVSRPDISFAVNLVSRYVNNPGKPHVNAVKRIIRYLSCTKMMSIVYDSNTELIGYSDSDFAGDIDTRKSTTGYLFLMNGGPVTWASRKQNTIALSTTESEYMAACDAAKEILWIKQFLLDIGESQNCFTLNVDNQSAIKLINNPVFHRRSKHIDVRYNFIREKVEQKIIQINYVESSFQLADFLTKALSHNKFNFIRDSVLKIFQDLV